MLKTITRRDALAGLSATFALTGAGAQAQTFPARQIQMILGFPPGPVYIVGRPVAAKLQEIIGQTVVFENRPGANGAIATEQVMRAAPDGYTILLATSGTHVTAVHLTKNLRYNPVKDFEPIIAAVEQFVQGNGRKANTDELQAIYDDAHDKANVVEAEINAEPDKAADRIRGLMMVQPTVTA